MDIMMYAKYVNGPAKVVVGKYGNGRIALQLVDAETGEPLCTATTNLVDHRLGDGCVFLKGWSENEGVPQSLVDAGVVEYTGRAVQAGYCHTDEYKLLIEVK